MKQCIDCGKQIRPKIKRCYACQTRHESASSHFPRDCADERLRAQDRAFIKHMERLGYVRTVGKTQLNNAGSAA